MSLNGETISSVTFTDELTNLKVLRIEIPTGILRFGENQLRVEADLLPITDCDYAGFAKYFVTILDETLIHIPVAPTPDSTAQIPLDLKMLPGIFLTHTNLDNLVFVLPEANPSSWSVASQIALELGNDGLPLIPEMLAYFGSEVPPEIAENHSLIFVGRSSELPLLAEINDELPAPFNFESDTASEEQMQVVYRIPPDVSIGYLELLPSPFNQSEAMLVVSGNTDEGVSLAGSTLIDSKLKSSALRAFCSD